MEQKFGSGHAVSDLGDIDPNRTDIYLCVPCTLPTAMHMRPALCFHGWHEMEQWREHDPKHFPPFGQQVTVAAQHAFFLYEMNLHTMDDCPYVGIDEFLLRRRFEDEIGLRSESVRGLMPHASDTHVNEVAKRSDATAMPMFPDEIQDFITDLRVKAEFPNQIANTPFYRDTAFTFGEVLSEGECLHLCSWADSKVTGAGSQLLGGQLTHQSISEQDVADAWVKAEAMERELGSTLAGDKLQILMRILGGDDNV